MAARRCSVAVIGGGMVGSATAMHMAKAGVRNVKVVSAPLSELPSSSNDYSRLVGTGGSADDRSVSLYPALQRESGVTFWQDVGLLEVFASASQQQSPHYHPQMAFDTFFSESGHYAAELTAHNRGWIDPRGFMRAARIVAERAGVEWLQGRVASVRQLQQEEEEGPRWAVSTEEDEDGQVLLHADVAVVTVGAFACLSPEIPSTEDTLMWGKVAYHGRLDEASAERLRSIPPLLLKPEAGTVPHPEVSYAGTKAGNYVYLFPPVRYDDGHHYIKIGHSPYDPIVASLGVAKEGEEASSADLHSPPPTEEQVSAWYAGADADPSSAAGRETRLVVSRSEAFFDDTLRRIFPGATWVDGGGHTTTCVTSKSRTGERLLDEVAPGVWHQTGCNGAGAVASLAWGEEVCQTVLASGRLMGMA